MDIQEEEKNAIKCILCLKLCLEECQLVTDGMTKMMALLLLTRGLDEKGQPVACNKCVDNLKTCFEFKSLCLSSADIVGSFTSAEASTKPNPLHLDAKQGTSKNLPENESLCQLCGISMSYDVCIPLTDNKSDAMFRILLIKYFPELGLNALWDTSHDLSVCVSCKISLESYFDVMKDWSTAGTNSEGNDVLTETAAQNSHDLDLVSHFAQKREHDDVDVGIANVNLQTECKGEIKSLECSLNAEESSFMGPATREELNIKLEEVDFKTDKDSCKKSEEDTRVSCQSSQGHNLNDITAVRKYQCEKCKYTTKDKRNFLRHSVIHQDPSEVTVYQCEQCEYKAVHKYYLHRHVATHHDPSRITMHPCDKCEYKAKLKQDLQRHLVMHQDPSEVIVYKCEKCEYKTVHKQYFQRHMAANHDPSKITMHQCDKCEYKTKHKWCLKQHMVTHKDASEVTMYQCEKCEYKAKQKYYLRRHMLTHQHLSEIAVYECIKCEYKAKRKRHLNQHMVIHQDPSETANYQCDKCDYKTKHKRGLQQHKMLHQDESELTMHQCDMCEYKSKYKDNLKKHIRICHDEAAGQMLRCEICKFTAKRTGDLKKHLVTHEDKSNVRTSECVNNADEDMC